MAYDYFQLQKKYEKLTEVDKGRPQFNELIITHDKWCSWREGRENARVGASCDWVKNWREL